MDALTKAYFRVKEEHFPIRKAARLYSIAETTLRHRVSGDIDLECVRSGRHPLFSMEQEA